MTATTELSVGAEKSLGDLYSSDLRAEATDALKEGFGPQAFFLTDPETGEVVGEMLWLSEIGRAGIATNGDAVWTDAQDEEDAVRRYNEDDLIA